MNTRSKIVSGLCLVFVPLLFAGCSKILQYDITYHTTQSSFTISPIGDTLVHTNTGSVMTSEDLDQYIKSNTGGTLGINNIKSAKIISATVTITNPDSADNFQNFESCNVAFSSNTDSALAQVGSITNNPDVYADSLVLPVNTSINYIDYLNGTQFNYSVSAQARRNTTTTLNCNITVAFTIHVQG